MAGSCRALGIHEERCVALDHPDLQDNPTVWWDTDLIAKIVHEHVLNWEVDAVCSLLGFLLSSTSCLARFLGWRPIVISPLPGLIG